MSIIASNRPSWKRLKSWMIGARKKSMRLHAVARTVLWLGRNKKRKSAAGVRVIRIMIYLARQLLHKDNSQRTPSAIWRSRIKTCLRCQLYNRRTLTCGSPDGQKWTNPTTGEREAMGCWCLMAMAAKVKQKECWIVQQIGPNDDWGWPEHLNGTNYERHSTP